MSTIAHSDGVSSKENVSTISDSPLGDKFDFVNWFYWAIWWQQYSHYATPYYCMGNSRPSGANEGFGNSQPQTTGDTSTSPTPGLGIHIRIITGYETVIAPLWKRLMAEVIDVCLFGLILKIFISDFEYRVPEIIFESSEVWKNMDEEELLEIRRLIMHFIASSIIQRLTHAAFEVVFLWLFGWTPGKRMLGLRVIKCSSSHLTRTVPGFSVRVEPGGKISLLQSVLRSLFKGTVSAFIPLIIFFFNLSHGRTRYDKLFGTIVVDARSLHRPLFINGQGFNHILNINLNHNQGRVHLQIR